MDSEIDSGAGEPAGPGFEPAGAEADTSAGVMLRAARISRGRELSHIAAETRIPIRHLEAIEAGDFASLPSRTYAIGFARTYARALDLDDAEITDAVRAELADGEGRRSAMGGGMEPGDPAKLPSAGLAWFGAFAALVLAVGMIAFFNSRFGAGTTPAPLVNEAAQPAASAPAASAEGSAPATPAGGGEVVFTALADGVWARFYEEGGERLLEKQLAKGERFVLPADASDPRINTGRPDLLAITVGGTSVPKLAETPVTIGGEPVSAAALLARNAVPAQAGPAAASDAPARGTPARRPREVSRRSSAPVPASADEGASDPVAAPASEPEPAPARGEAPAN